MLKMKKYSICEKIKWIITKCNQNIFRFKKKLSLHHTLQLLFVHIVDVGLHPKKVDNQLEECIE